jgi:uncharacterized protein YlzI (FlbEa/FlbD family)
MMKLKLLLFLLTCCLSINAQSWEKIYQNDENGKPLFGNKHALIEAIKAGKDVKIMMMNGDFEYYTPAENIWIKDGTVTIQNTQQVAVKDDLTIQSDAYNWIIMVNTNGVRHMSRWRLGEHTNKGDNKDKVNVTWFVR